MKLPFSRRHIEVTVLAWREDGRLIEQEGQSFRVFPPEDLHVKDRYGRVLSVLRFR